MNTGFRQLEQRRRRLGMSHRALARRSGVSEPTVKRILAGHSPEAAAVTVFAIAAALGVSVRFDEEEVAAVKRREAQRKAERIANLVQGTSALEAQGIDESARRELIEQTVHELLAGSPRRLWEE